MFIGLGRELEFEARVCWTLRESHPTSLLRTRQLYHIGKCGQDHQIVESGLLGPHAVHSDLVHDTRTRNLT